MSNSKDFSPISETQYQNGYEKNLPRFEKAERQAKGIISSALSDANISHLQISSRVKSFQSSYDKYLEKKYANPFTDATDFVGIRVILFLEKDIDLARQRIESCMRVDRENSVDKRSQSSVNLLGYRSLHIVCDLGPEREKLKEYEGISDLKIEIQVRTVLQHDLVAHLGEGDSLSAS